MKTMVNVDLTYYYRWRVTVTGDGDLNGDVCVSCVCVCVCVSVFLCVVMSPETESNDRVGDEEKKIATKQVSSVMKKRSVSLLAESDWKFIVPGGRYVCAKRGTY